MKFSEVKEKQEKKQGVYKKNKKNAKKQQKVAESKKKAKEKEAKAQIKEEEAQRIEANKERLDERRRIRAEHDTIRKQEKREARREERRQRAEERKEQRMPLWQKILIGVGAFAGALVVAALFLIFGCRVREIEVAGNSYFSEQEIRQYILADSRCENSIYAYAKYRWGEQEKKTFLNHVEVSLASPNKLVVNVVEQQPIGYITNADLYLYFDDMGILTDRSDVLLEGLPEITGLSIDAYRIGEAIPIKSRDLVQKIVTICYLSMQYEIPVTTVHVDENMQISLAVPDIDIRLGEGTDLEDKMIQLPAILSRLSGEKGTLHLETYNGADNTITFQKTNSDG